MKLKLVISLVLAFLAFVFITQNTETVQVTFLAWSWEMSLVILVFVMLGAGLIIGWLLNSYLRFSHQRKKARDAQLTANTAVKTDSAKEQQPMAAMDEKDTP
ncbi:MAG: LapA family protein [Desulfuromonadales bacterium]